MPGDSLTLVPTRTAARRDGWIDALWLVVLVVWSASYCLTASARTGATFDEPFYLRAGIHDWYYGAPLLTAINGVMPLPIFASTLPIFAEQVWTGVLVQIPLDQLPRARAVTLG